MLRFYKIFQRFYRAKIVVLLINFMFILFSAAQSRQELETNPGLEKEHLQSLIEQIAKIDQATQHARKAIKTMSDSSFLPQLLFQLSELELRREKLHFEFELVKYERKLAAAEKQDSSNLPQPPSLSYANTLNINQQILNDYPNIDFTNKIRYRNAICYYEIGQKDSSKNILLELIPQCADTSLLAELFFRLGECYFEKGDHRRALTTYQQILKKWNSPFFAMALYKIAWCHYQMDHISDAISTFYYLLNDIHLLEKIDSEILGKTQIELRQEAVDYIAIGFSDYGGLKALLQFIQKMGPSEYDPDFLFKLGEVNFKRNFYKKTIQVFDVLIRKFPTYQKLPEVYLSLFESFDQIGRQKMAHSMFERLVKTCGPGSGWAFQNYTQEDKEYYDDIACEIKFKMATPILKTADSLFVVKRFRQAALNYVNFLGKFPEDTRSDHALYQLAESFINLNQYKLAANNYKKVVLNFPDSKFFEDAAYNRLFCYDQILGSSKIDVKDTTHSAENSPEIKNLIQACYDFLEWIPNSARTPEIMLKLAELFYHQKMFDLSEKYAKATIVFISKQNKGLTYQLTALELLAQINLKNGKYKKAQQWYAVLKNQKPDSSGLVKKCDQMITSAQFKIGELLKNSGHSKQAAISFQKTARNATNPQIASAALFEAAIQFEKMEQLQNAAGNLEMIYQQYPTSKKAREAAYRAGALRERMKQWHLAAKNYLELFALLENPAEKSGALFNAGLSFEKAKDWRAASDIFAQFTDEFPNDPNLTLTAMFKTGSSFENSGNLPKAGLWYQKALNLYKRLNAAGEFPDEFVAAEITFRMAELKNVHFKKLKLIPPLQLKLQQKRKAFNDLLSGYVAVTKFGIAEWTTAAFYRIGLSYEKFCQDILNAPIPANLNRNQQKEYLASIQLQYILPLQKEAFKYYQSNQKLALQNGIKNDWITSSQERMLIIREQLANHNAIPLKDQFKQATGTVDGENQSQRRRL